MIRTAAQIRPLAIRNEQESARPAPLLTSAAVDKLALCLMLQALLSPHHFADPVFVTIVIPDPASSFSTPTPVTLLQPMGIRISYDSILRFIHILLDRIKSPCLRSRGLSFSPFLALKVQLWPPTPAAR